MLPVEIVVWAKAAPGSNNRTDKDNTNNMYHLTALHDLVFTSFLSFRFIV
jgi:hypothetical protein